MLFDKTYNILPGQHSISSCIKCISGKWSRTVGSNSSNNCIRCNKGLYSEIAGATASETCISCAAGKYSNIYGANSISNCQVCTNGQYSNSGSNICKNSKVHFKIWDYSALESTIYNFSYRLSSLEMH